MLIGLQKVLAAAGAAAPRLLSIALLSIKKEVKWAGDSVRARAAAATPTTSRDVTSFVHSGQYDSRLVPPGSLTSYLATWHAMRLWLRGWLPWAGLAARHVSTSSFVTPQTERHAERTVYHTVILCVCLTASAPPASSSWHGQAAAARVP